MNFQNVTTIISLIIQALGLGSIAFPIWQERQQRKRERKQQDWITTQIFEAVKRAPEQGVPVSVSVEGKMGNQRSFTIQY